MTDMTLTQRIADAKALLAKWKWRLDRGYDPEETPETTEFWRGAARLFEEVEPLLAALVDACEGLRAENARLRAALEQITRRVDEEGNDNILACGLADLADVALRGAGEGTE